MAGNLAQTKRLVEVLPGLNSNALVPFAGTGNRGPQAIVMVEQPANSKADKARNSPSL
jgi:hypothetical protein